MFDTELDQIGLPAGEDPDDFQVDHGVESSPESERHVLPDDLESIVPGPFLAAILSSVDRSKLNGHDAVRMMQAEARLASHFEAGKLASMFEVAHSPAGGRNSPVRRSTDEIEYASVEIAAALSLTRRAAERQLDLALSMGTRLRRVWGRLRQGLIDIRKAVVFDRQIGHLSQESVDTVTDSIIEDASDLTTGQLQARLARTVMEVDPEGVEVGYAKGLEDRKVVSYANPDHTATVAGQSIAPDDTAAITNRINKIARSLKTKDEARTLDQIRADVFVDLLLGRAEHGTSATGGAHLRTDLATLAELSDAPGELAGYGPVIADIARQTALTQVDGKWTFEVTDQTGDLIATGTTARRPDAKTVREIQARYATCTFVGCRMPAYDCDLDHRQPHAQGGSTDVLNMAPLCRHHHMAKHHAPWRMKRRVGGGHRWISPLGHEYEVGRARGIEPEAPD